MLVLVLLLVLSTCSISRRNPISFLTLDLACPSFSKVHLPLHAYASLLISSASFSSQTTIALLSSGCMSSMIMRCTSIESPQHERGPMRFLFVLPHTTFDSDSFFENGTENLKFFVASASSSHTSSRSSIYKKSLPPLVVHAFSLVRKKQEANTAMIQITPS